MKFIAICLLFLSIVLEAYCADDFVLAGKTNLLINGTAILRKVARGDFYRSYVNNDTAKIINHHFKFSGKIIYPELFRITIYDSRNNFISEIFFLDSGMQHITIDTQTVIKSSFDVGHGVNLIGSKADCEYTNIYLPLFKEVNMRMDSYYTSLNLCDSLPDKNAQESCEKKLKIVLKIIRENRNDIIYKYSLQNKMSPILPWVLYEAIRRYGYKDTFSSIYDSTNQYYSENVSIELDRILTIQKAKTIGQVFPLLNLIYANDSSILQNNKLTLVEFWFSACHPCLAQFEALRPVYKKYNKKGFEIVAISIDNEQSLGAYKKLLLEKKYPWKQILDSNGLRTFSINVEKFPSSFLLDDKGKLMSIDLTPDSLDSFLEQNINL